MNEVLENKIEVFLKCFSKLNDDCNFSYDKILQRYNQFSDNCESDDCSYMGRINLNHASCIGQAKISDGEFVSNCEEFEKVFFHTRVISCLNCDNYDCQVGKSQLSRYLSENKK